MKDHVRPSREMKPKYRTHRSLCCSNERLLCSLRARRVTVPARSLRRLGALRARRGHGVQGKLTACVHHLGSPWALWCERWKAWLCLTRVPSRSHRIAGPRPGARGRHPVTPQPCGFTHSFAGSQQPQLSTTLGSLQHVWVCAVTPLTVGHLAARWFLKTAKQHGFFKKR